MIVTASSLTYYITSFLAVCLSNNVYLNIRTDFLFFTYSSIHILTDNALFCTYNGSSDCVCVCILHA